MEVGLVEECLSMPDVKQGGGLRLRTPQSAAVHTSRALYLPLGEGVEEIRLDVERLTVAHVDYEGEVVNLVVCPAVGGSEYIGKVVTIACHDGGLVAVGVVDDVEARLEMGLEVVGIVDTGTHIVL